MKLDIAIPPWAVSYISDHTDMIRNPHPVDARKVRRFGLTLPDDAYFEYAFIDADGRVRADPANPLRADNPWYPEASAAVGPGYRPHHLADPPEGLPLGTTDRPRLESRHLGQTRRVVVYTPAGHLGEPLPLLLVQDGIAYLRIARLPQVLEALLAEGAVRPARLAFLEPRDRLAEYGFDPAYRAFVREELLPFLETAFPSSGERILMGASLGGLVSAVLALEEPERFHGLVTQSGAFLGNPREREFYRSKDSWVLDRLRDLPPLLLRWYLETGTLEWLRGVNRDVRDALEAKGTTCRYQERNAGHNWVNWRNGLAAALTFALEPGA